jgi:tRNA U38,U39,U40 pseudouridine synthase TruA
VTFVWCMISANVLNCQPMSVCVCIYIYVYTHVNTHTHTYDMQQIRKMVGLAIYALRFKKDEERVAFVKSVMHDKEKRYVPLAPSLGLMLERYASCAYTCMYMRTCMCKHSTHTHTHTRAQSFICKAISEPRRPWKIHDCKAAGFR